jgi:hypothetical protein
MGLAARDTHLPSHPPKFIMLPNELFALGCRAWYEEQGLIVDSSNGEFAHSPLTRKECDTGHYLLHGHHQHHGLLQSKDLNKCCFFAGNTKKWLLECGYFPENYFELWDIYEKYSNHLWENTLGKYLEENPDHAKNAAVKVKKENPSHFTENYERTLGVLQEDKEAYSEMCRKSKPPI